MPERIPQSATIRVPLQAYLSSDHITPATGKTIAVTISKNGAAYGNPSGGATNATAIASGSYYVDLSTTDTGTTGPLFILGTEGTIDNVVTIYDVVNANTLGAAALPNTAITTNASLITSGTGTDQISNSSGKLLLQATQSGVTIPTVTAVTNQLTAAAIATGVWQDATSGDFTASSSIGKSLYTTGAVPGAANGLVIAGTNAATSFATGSHFIGTVDTVTTTTTATTATNLTNAPTAGDFTATMKTSIGTAVAASAVASVTGAVGSVASGGISRASFAAETGLQSIRSNTASGGAASSITLDGAASATNNYYSGLLVYLTGGTGAGQVRKGRGYVGSSKVLTVTPAWTTTPDNTTTFALLSSMSEWDEVVGDHLASGSTGAALNAAGSAGDPWTTVLPGAYGAGTAGFIVGTNIDAAVTSRLAPTTAVPGAFGAGTAGFILGTNLDVAVSSRLAPTVAARTLDVSAGGEAGLDWANIGTPGSTVGLTATTLSAVTNVSTVANVTTVNGLAANVITAASIASDADAEIASAIWDLATVGHTTSGTFGAAMNNAGSVGNPWDENLPGAHAAGTAGFIVGTNINALITSRMATYSQPSGFLAATFPSGTIANQTNITGGTITTATNLTNAPTVGDFTSTMKTSLNAATPASITGSVGSVTGNVGGNVVGSVASVTAGVSLAASQHVIVDSGTVTTLTNLPAITTNWLTSAGINAGALNGKGDWLATGAMTESYAALHAAPTPAQAFYAILQKLYERSVVGTTETVKKLDGSTTAITETLDNATLPTSVTRAS